MKKRGIISKIRICAVFLFGLLSCLLLSACAREQAGADAGDSGNPVTVCLEQGRGFSAKSYIQTIEGEAEFQLRLQEDYEITNCSYEDYSVEEADNGYTLLLLHNVKYPARVTITCEIPEAIIYYDPNGGSFADTGSIQPLRFAYTPSAHYRINTLSGEEKILREGYVMTGWNTKADGSGQHIGLGSRITAEKNTQQYLYAEWEKAADAEYFEWEDTAEGICLTRYSGGNTASLVIPREINGKTVTAIGEGFAQQISIERLVVPDSVLAIENGAFRNCTIGQIYFSDTLQQVSDASFEESRPAYWHINAATRPRYQATSDICVFADKMDLLLLHEEEKKLLLFSGCSMNYGMDSQLLAEAYPDYTVLNLGAVGGTNAQFQLEIILQYIHSGDIFIHAPEEGSPYQLMSVTDCENRMFIAVEGNYDLLAAVDMTTLGDGAFDSFREYNEKRSSIDPCTYEDRYIPVNGYGDNDSERIASNKARFDEEYGLHPEYITEDGLNVLCSYYDRIREAGASVYLSYAPINALCCSREEISDFSAAWEQGMQARGYETISKLQDYVMEAENFYDADYHLTTAGAAARTERLIEDLAFLKQSGEL